ncbi:MAG: diacylglycerol kinase family protein [Bacteroidota bacterium]
MSHHKKRLRFIVNPFSGIGKKGRLPKQIENHLDHHQFEYDIQYTQRPRHATELAKAAVAQNFDVVVAVGGDGSVNEVAAALIDSDVILGIIPAGSGNGFARHLGLSTKTVRAIHQLNQGQPITIDSCTMNGRPFVNLAGLGFDGWVSYKLQQRKVRGLLAYVRFITQESFTFQPQTYQIEIDGQPLREECLCLEIVNAPMLGYNFEIAPHAKCNDGILEIVVVKKMSPWKMPRFAWHSYQKSLEKTGLTKYFSGKKIKIRIQEETPVHMDGEGMLVQEDLTFTINPMSLRVLVP